MIRWTKLTGRIVLAVLFAYAGSVKLINPDVFLADIDSYRMIPYPIAWLVAFGLPPFEIVCGLALLIPQLRNEGAGLLLLLMFIFMGALSVAWARGLNIACGCFGASTSGANYPWLMLRDMVITAALLCSRQKT